MEFIKKRTASDAGQLSTELKNASLWKNETACTELGDRSAITRPRTISHYLHVRDFNFAISKQDTIQGIEVRIHRKGKGISDYYVGLIYPDGQNLTISDNLSNPGFWTDSEAIVTYGGPNELWGTNMTPDQVNDHEFGIGISVQDNSKSNTAYIDYVEMLVYVNAGVVSGGIVLGGKAPPVRPISAEGGIKVSGISEDYISADASGGSQASGSADVFLAQNPKVGDTTIVDESEFGTVWAKFSLEGSVFTWDIHHNIPRVQEIQTRHKETNDVSLYIGKISRQVDSPVSAFELLNSDQVEEVKNDKLFLRIRPVGNIGDIGLDKWGYTRGIKLPVTIFRELTPSGSAKVSSQETRSSQGGASLGGACVVHKVVDLGGGSVASPSHEQSVEFNVVGSGGMKAVPSALDTGPIHEMPEGGMKAGGESRPTFVMQPSVIAEFKIGGDAKTMPPYFEVIEGGSEIGGNADNSMVFNVRRPKPIRTNKNLIRQARSKWGLHLDVSETNSFIYQPTSSGGSEMCGSADVQCISNPEVGSTKRIAIKSNHYLSSNPVASGGTSAGARSVIQIAPAIGGGATANSGTKPQQTFNPLTGGGISLGGCMKLQQIYEAYQPGRSFVRSLSMVSALSTYSETPIGGTYLLGRAKVEMLKNHQPSRPSMLATMLSDHIFREPEEELTAEMQEAPAGLRYENLPKWCEVGGCRGDDSAALPAIVVERQKPHVPLKDRGKAIRDRGIARVS